MSAANETWEAAKARHPIGSQVEGSVVAVPHYGVWVVLGTGFKALMRIPECGLGRGEQTADHFTVGDKVTAKVIWLDDVKQEFILSRRA